MRALILFILLVLAAHGSFAQCSDNGNQWARSWTSCTKQINPNPNRPVSHWVLYEFSANHYIDSSHIWNSNRIGESSRGIKDIIVDYSLDGIHWTELGSFVIPQAPETTDYKGVAGPNFNSVYIKKILITVLSTHGAGSCAAIGEMLFAINAAECHGITDNCGNCNGPGAPTWYADEDGDGLGNIHYPLVDCEQPAGYVNNANDLCDNGQIGWSEISLLFQKSCNGCHIENSAGGLNLSSYVSFLQGGNSCGSSIAAGSLLVGTITIDGFAGCSTPISAPAMNSRSSNPLSAIEIDMIQRWIDAGTPESCVDFCLEQDLVHITFPEGISSYRQSVTKILSTSLLEYSSKVTFDAGQQIELENGFTISQGAQFLAKIGGCEQQD